MHNFFFRILKGHTFSYLRQRRKLSIFFVLDNIIPPISDGRGRNHTFSQAVINKISSQLRKPKGTECFI